MRSKYSKEEIKVNLEILEGAYIEVFFRTPEHADIIKRLKATYATLIVNGVSIDDMFSTEHINEARKIVDIIANTAKNRDKKYLTDFDMDLSETLPRVFVEALLQESLLHEYSLSAVPKPYFSGNMRASMNHNDVMIDFLYMRKDMREKLLIKDLTKIEHLTELFSERNINRLKDGKLIRSRFIEEAIDKLSLIDGDKEKEHHELLTWQYNNRLIQCIHYVTTACAYGVGTSEYFTDFYGEMYTRDQLVIAECILSFVKQLYKHNGCVEYDEVICYACSSFGTFTGHTSGVLMCLTKAICQYHNIPLMIK